MNDPEIIALRKVLAQRVRSDDVAQRRRDIDARGRAYKLAADVTVEPVTANGVRSEWTATPDADPGKAVLYLHGGGYVIGSLDSHRHVIAEMGRAARARGAITIAGDSAGGGLVVAAMLAIRDAGLPQPACGWTVSPWVDMEAIGDSMVSKAATDPTVQKAGILDMAKQYLNGADSRSPLAAPIYGDLRGLAPLLIQVGAAEVLFDDSIRLAQVAGAADVAVDLQIWPEMIHVWHIYHPELAAGRRAIAAGGEFARAMTSRGSRGGF